MTEGTNEERWLVGIDLGTTHCALAIKRPGSDRFELVEIPQFVEVGQVAGQTLLPSFGLQPDAH
jgi:molecular chaperone DnaK (HSP70)